MKAGILFGMKHFFAETELVDGMAPTGAPVEWVEEPSYFFNLSAWQDKLLAFYDKILTL